jgi:hypothetical protein
VSSVYKITYPNNLIYIGLDLLDIATYMGSPSVTDQIADDLGPELCRDFTVRKQILWQSATATATEARAMEMAMIREYRSNDPAIGYNRFPRVRSGTNTDLRWPKNPETGADEAVAPWRTYSKRKSEDGLWEAAFRSESGEVTVLARGVSDGQAYQVCIKHKKMMLKRRGGLRRDRGATTTGIGDPHLSI